MNEKNEKADHVFSDVYRMETETVYQEDGQISVYPCDYELGQQITASGGTVHMEGKIVVNPDGQIGIKPYHRGSVIRYKILFNTDHGIVKETKEDIIIKLQFHKRNGRFTTADKLEDEVDDMLSYLEKTKEIKEWQ